MRIESIIEISAPVARVWDLTVDVESWPRMTPTITRIDWLSAPPIGIGSQARIKQPAQGAKIWTVTALESERCLAWSTRSMGLTMTGTHLLTATETGTTNTLWIDLEGPLAWIVGTLFRRLIRNALRTENAGFKAAAERDRFSAG